MTQSALEQLLGTFEVDVTALAVCELRKGFSLVGEPQDAIILHYVLSGTMHLTVGDEFAVVCPQGSVVIVSPGLCQTIAADGPPTEILQASQLAALTDDGLIRVDASGDGQPDLRFACGEVSTNLPCLSALLDEARGLIVEDMNDAAVVRHAFDAMLEEFVAEGTAARALSSALMKSCLLLTIRRRIARAEPGSATFPPLRHPGLRKAINSVLSEPAAPHSVTTLAVAAGMSRSSFAKAFSAAFDMTPMAFVTTTRLHQAVDLLRSTPAPVKAVAAAVGFSSRSHFSRAFRDAYGADPSQFRKLQATAD